MEEAFENLNLGLIVDDILICGADDREHDEKLKAALEFARDKKVKFNQEKCVFGLESIPYFEHLLISEGIKPDPEKNRAITDMPLPKNSEQLQKLLGMLNYLSRCIPNLSSLNKSLSELALADEYKWKPAHEKAFSKIKSAFCSNLAYFDPTCENIEIKVDASKHSLGAVLAVDNNVVAFR
ncbi:hypothetical protein QYM36_009212 [Artemia franciscana]|uniref:Reverse transcriptase domain-containing protein n=1 Tax=Artemia franciscana TaxID=6661 RepID=A0AA88L1R2_ARTSF|nr:hypothetical protein QYM36_009212 [Artemia franciscana]